MTTRGSTRELVRQAIEADPHASERELGQRLGIAYSTINQHRRRLVADGLIAERVNPYGSHRAQIAALLLADPLASNTAIGRQLGISATAVRFHRKALVLSGAVASRFPPQGPSPTPAQRTTREKADALAEQLRDDSMDYGALLAGRMRLLRLLWASREGR